MDPRNLLLWLGYTELLRISLLNTVFVGVVQSDFPVGYTRENDSTVFVSAEERLFTYLFERYNYRIRPVRTASQAVHVALTFSLMQIHSLDEKTQVFRTYGWLIVEWADLRLTWPAEQFDNITEFVVDSTVIWTPELALINAVEYQFPDFSNYRAIVQNAGKVRWEPAGVFETSCKIDITFYPYDRQDCALVFGTWAYTSMQVNLTNSTEDVVLDDYNTSGEWHIGTTEMERKEFIYECCPHIRFSKVSVKIHLIRRHRFFTMNLILPAAMLSSLTLVTFLSPPDQGEKISLGISILLSFSVFMLSLSENMPKTSESLPLFGVYTTFIMMMNTWSVMLTVFVLNLHHRHQGFTIPKWVRTFVFEGLARVLCMHSKEETSFRKDYFKYSSKYGDKDKKEQSVPLRGKKSSVKDGFSLASAAQHFGKMQTTMFIPPSTGGLSSPGGVGGDSNSHTNHVCHHGHARLDAAGGKNSYSQDDYKRDYEQLMHSEQVMQFELQEWKRLARVIDRLFFWMTLLSLISVSAGMLFLLWTN